MKRVFIIIGLILLLHIYIGAQLLPALHSTDLSIFGVIFLIASAFIIPLGVMAKFLIKDQHISDILSWIGLLDMGLFSSLLILTFIRQLLLHGYALYSNITPIIFQDSSVLVIVLAFAITLIGLVNARRVAKVINVDIPIKDLPECLNGFSIAQISDIHVGPTIKRNYLQAIVDSVNELNADMVAITGDLVDGSVENLSYHTEPLAELKSRYGSFFVLGNHEYYSGADAWSREIKRLGINVLMNQNKIISHNGYDILIAGVTDYSGESFGYTHKSDPQAAIDNLTATDLKILLAHQPRSAFAAEKHGFDLQLSGHTHGGQFWPWNLFVRLQQPFTAGLGKINNMWVYTNRGTGYWGPPKRFGVSSEITLLRLVRANK